MKSIEIEAHTLSKEEFPKCSDQEKTFLNLYIEYQREDFEEDQRFIDCSFFVLGILVHCFIGQGPINWPLSIFLIFLHSLYSVS